MAQKHISEQVQDVQSFHELADFIDKLRSHLRESPEAWESHTIDDYLEAMSAWVREHYTYCKATNQDLPGDEVWRMIAQILLSASAYE